MSFDITALEQVLVPVFQSLLPAFVNDPSVDIRVIRGEQSKPRPQEDTYADLRVADFNQVGRERVGTPDGSNDDLTPVRGDYRAILRIRGVGKKAKLAASMLQFGFNNPSFIDQLEAVGFAFLNNTDLTHIPILTETAWEERSQFNVAFHWRQSADIDLGVIETVESVDGTLQDCGGNTIQSPSSGSIPTIEAGEFAAEFDPEFS